MAPKGELTCHLMHKRNIIVAIIQGITGSLGNRIGFLVSVIQLYYDYAEGCYVVGLQPLRIDVKEQK